MLGKRRWRRKRRNQQGQSWTWGAITIAPPTPPHPTPGSVPKVFGPAACPAFQSSRRTGGGGDKTKGILPHWEV